MTVSQGSTFDDPTELMTTTLIDFTNQTTGSSMTSSTSRSAGFYFQCAVVVIGFVGAALNGLILYALIASKQHRKHVLIFNQNLLDFVSCIFLFTMHTVKLCNVSLNGGARGYWLCVIILSEALSLSPLLGSFINLAAITIERYLRIVHHVWAKKKLRNWMIYSLIPFTWIGGCAVGWGWTIPTTNVVGGVCYTLMLWKSHTARLAFAIWYFLTFYVALTLTFIFCYGRILIVIRRQASVMASHSGPGEGPNAAQVQTKKMQIKISKTMILVSALYIIVWSPGYLHGFLMNVSTAVAVGDAAFYVIVVVGYLYNWVNPFIYAANFDPVKHVLLRLIPWKRNLQPPASFEMT